MDQTYALIKTYDKIRNTDEYKRVISEIEIAIIGLKFDVNVDDVPFHIVKLLNHDRYTTHTRSQEMNGIVDINISWKK